jgi:hypothetical protein
VVVLTNFYSQQAPSEDSSSEGTQYNQGHLSSANSEDDMPIQPDLPLSALRKRLAPEPVAPRVQLAEGQSVCTKKARQGTPAPSHNQESLVSGEVYFSCFSNPLSWYKLTTSLSVRNVASQACSRLILKRSNQRLHWQVMNRDRAPSCSNSSVSGPCFRLPSRHWSRILLK